jgi:predicted phosphodiesterase
MTTPPRGVDVTIRARLEAGGSVKGIARELGVTEWRVRCAKRSATTRLAISRKPSEVRLHTVRVGKEKVQRALVLSDIHIPYHDHGALAIALHYARDYKPDIIVLNGDVLDFHEVSSHPQDKHEVITFEDELAEGRQFLRVLRHDHPRAEIHYCIGNHEDRLQRYLHGRAPELSSMPELALDRVLDLETVRIAFCDARSKVQLGPLEVFHGSIIRKDSGNSARAHMQRRGGSILMGHTHRMATVARTDRHGVSWAVENGHLSDPDPSWCSDPDWQQGFTQVEFTATDVSIRQHHIRAGRMVVDGAVYVAAG